MLYINLYVPLYLPHYIDSSAQDSLVFSWNSSFSNCSAIHYNILASNCGSCPTTTNHTTATCTDVSTDGSVCNFTVQTIVCENSVGVVTHLLPLNKTTGSTIDSVVVSLLSVGILLFLAVVCSVVVILLAVILFKRIKWPQHTSHEHPR